MDSSELNEKELACALKALRIPDGNQAEIEGYLHDNIARILYSYNLVDDLRGKCLELGAAPYFMTLLLKKFTDLDMVLGNYFGPSAMPDRFIQDIIFRNKHESWEIHHFNIEDSAPFNDSQFDVVLFCEILEHLVVDPLKVLLEIKRILKKGGTLFLTTPNACRAENVRRILSGQNPYDHYSFYGPLGRHNREYTIYEVFSLMDYCGFSIESIFTANVSSSDLIERRLKPLLAGRKDDLGETIFVRASNTKAGGEKLPSFLYRGYAPEKMTAITVQNPHDIAEGMFLGATGWHGLELWEGGEPSRWICGEAAVYAYAASECEAKLTLRANSCHSPRDLQLRVNDLPIDTYTIPTDFRNVASTVTLRKGRNELRFLTDPGVRPSDVPELNNSDTRRLSVAFQKIRLKTRGLCG